MFGQGYTTARPQHDLVVACVNDTTDATTYSGGVWTGITLPGINDRDTVAIMVTVVGEDDATSFGVNSMTVDAQSMIELADQNGTGLVDAAVYRGNNGGFSGNAWFRNAATVDLSITFSEAVTGAAACVWAKRNSETTGAGATSQVDDDTAGGTLTLSYTTPNQPQSSLVGMCISENQADTATWTVLSEVGETANAEFAYSWARLDYGPGSGIDGVATLTPTCDWSNANDNAGVTGGLNR